MTEAQQRIRDRVNAVKSPPMNGKPHAPSDDPNKPAPIPEFRPFPVHCLPEKVQEFAKIVSASTTAHLAYVALPLLSVLGAAIGTTRAVMPKRGWKVFAVIWAIWVGRSSAVKSPPHAIINEAVQIVEDRLDEENAQLAAQYLVDMVEFEAGNRDEEPKQPATLRFRLSDVTIEALATILEGNPRGAWLSTDEGSSWLDSFARYKGKTGGSDRSRWLSLFDAGSMTIGRRRTRQARILDLLGLPGRGRGSRRLPQPPAPVRHGTGEGGRHAEGREGTREAFHDHAHDGSVRTCPTGRHFRRFEPRFHWLRYWPKVVPNGA